MAVRELSEVGCLLLPGVGRLELGLPGVHTSAFQAKLCFQLIIFFTGIYSMRVAHVCYSVTCAVFFFHRVGQNSSLLSWQASSLGEISLKSPSNCVSLGSHTASG